jgi:hypothetical protein
MPLILAIEPDHRQAAQLTQIARHRVGADLLLADTTERALDVIGDRVPDLVLVPALLSPQDDAALAAALRVIAAAAHVQTLTIPLFAASAPKRTGRGVLGLWRRNRESPAADGCDPAVFAEQISSYLKERAADLTALDRSAQPAARYTRPATLTEEAAPATDAAPELDEALETFVDDTMSAGAGSVPVPEADVAPFFEHAADRVADEAVPFVEYRETIASYAAPEVQHTEPAREEAAVPAAVDGGDQSAPPFEYAARFFDEIRPVEHAAPTRTHDDESVAQFEYGTAAMLGHAAPGVEDLALAAPQLADAVSSFENAVEIMDATVEPVVEARVEDAGPSVEGRAPVFEEEVLVGAAVVSGVECAEPPVDAPIASERPEKKDEPRVIEDIAPADGTLPAFEIVEVDLSAELGLSGEATAKAPASNRRLTIVPAARPIDVTRRPHAAAEFERWVPHTCGVERLWPALEGMLVEERAPRAEPVARAVRPERVKPVARPAPVVRLAPTQPIERAARPAPVSPIAEPAEVERASRPEPVKRVARVKAVERVARPEPERSVRAEPVERAARPEPVEQVAAPPRAERTERPEWKDLVASLRQDIERRRDTPEPPPIARKAPRHPNKPVQDEWGFFDPEQCGFAALLAKLDEITDTDDTGVRPR